MKFGDRDDVRKDIMHPAGGAFRLGADFKSEQAQVIAFMRTEHGAVALERNGSGIIVARPMAHIEEIGRNKRTIGGQGRDGDGIHTL